MNNKQQRRYFGTDGIRGRVGSDVITPEFILKLGWAAGKCLASGRRSKILIGKDTRISGYLLESALEAGLSAAGVDILLVGPMPTPAIAFLTRTLRAQAGIVISASHNPYEDNGIKFFSADGNKLDDDIELAIEHWLDQPMQTVDPQQLGKAQRIDDAAARYIEFCKRSISNRLELTGLKIVVDCAHGATYQIAPKILRELGAQVIAIGNQPDGFNINAKVGSTSPELLQQTVSREKAHVGIAFDGDGDRLLMVDDKGNIMDGDALLYAITLDRVHAGLWQGGVVGTQMTNMGLESALKRKQIPFVRTQVGDRHVLSALKEKGWQLGGESSGHIICMDVISTGDGIIAALQVLSAMQRQNKSLMDLLTGFEKYPQTLVNVKTQTRVDLEHPSIVAAVQSIENTLTDKGRVLLRRSGTESLVRVMVEGEDQHLISTLAHDLANVVRSTI